VEHGVELLMIAFLTNQPFVCRPSREPLYAAMLRAYVADVFAKSDVSLILLLSKANLISLYQRCGFTFVRVSPVSHGKETWFEMQTGKCHDTVQKRIGCSWVVRMMK
jgi:hypothetical protein